MTSPSIDGYASGIASTTNSVSATLTTAHTNDIICALIYVEQSGGGPAVTGVSGGGLTWALRKRSNGSQRGSYELWWALAPSTLSSVSITASYGSNFDDAAMVVFGVQGCNTSAPWDPNSSLPAAGSLNLPTGTAGYPALTGSTTNADDLIIFGVGNGWTWPVAGSTPPTGFSVVAMANNAGGTNFGKQAVWAEAVAATQSAITVTAGSAVSDAGTSSSAGSSTEFILDALTSDGSSGAGSTINIRPVFFML